MGSEIDQLRSDTRRWNPQPRPFRRRGGEAGEAGGPCKARRLAYQPLSPPARGRWSRNRTAKLEGIQITLLSSMPPARILRTRAWGPLNRSAWTNELARKAVAESVRSLNYDCPFFVPRSSVARHRTRQTVAASKMASTDAARDRSLMGCLNPCRIGPMASAPARCSVNL